MWKTKIFKMSKFLRVSIIFLIIFAWIFSGWPQIFNFPSEIQKAQAAITYQRTPNGISITSPVNFKISMDEYIGVGYDSGCNIGTASKTYYNGMPYWGLAFLNKDRSDFIAISDELVPSTTLSHTFTKNFPAGTEIGEIIFICSETPEISFDNWYLTQYTGNDLEILDSTNPIIITTVSTSSTSQ